MISQALHATTAPSSSSIDGAWVSRTAGLVLAALEERRSTWQTWHVRAEAQRNIRAAEVPTAKVDELVDRVVAEILNTRSVSLARPDDTITEPAALRRSDGSSVYTVAGSELFTSARILAAEQRVVAVAGHMDGRTAPAGIVELALLEQAANGVTLDPGQAALVRSMSMSGARLQLAIAPAGAGKTTAVRALTPASIDSGGQVVGLAPSAAAAALLRDSTGAPTDTLAKLTWSIDHGDLPDWALSVGESTLLIIDEAGMADTLSLDTAVDFVVRRGGSVRLIGDDQQLAAIGAGVCCAISKPSAAPTVSPKYADSTTQPSPLPRSPCGTADPKRSASTLTAAASTSATPPQRSSNCSPHGRQTATVASTRSCWRPPVIWSSGSTREPVSSASTTPGPTETSNWPTEIVHPLAM
jgi:hypothetical protein